MFKEHSLIFIRLVPNKYKYVEDVFDIDSLKDIK